MGDQFVLVTIDYLQGRLPHRAVWIADPAQTPKGPSSRKETVWTPTVFGTQDDVDRGKELLIPDSPTVRVQTVFIPDDDIHSLYRVFDGRRTEFLNKFREG